MNACLFKNAFLAAGFSPGLWNGIETCIPLPDRNHNLPEHPDFDFPPPGPDF